MKAEPERDPAWTIGFDSYDSADEHRREALLALGNGMFVVRNAWVGSSAEERHYPGTYRAGCYDRLLSEIEGERVETESLVNLSNWLPLDLRIEDDPWLGLHETELLEYRHVLDMAEGQTVRTMTLRDSRGRSTRLVERRLVSMAEPHLMALRLEVVPLDWSGRMEIRAGLDGGVENGNVQRYAPFSGRHLQPPRRGTGPDGVVLATGTRSSAVRIVAAQRVRIEGGVVLLQEVTKEGSTIAEHLACRAEQGRRLSVEKTVALATSLDPAIADPATAACSALGRAPAFEALEAGHREAWSRLWARTGLEVEREDIRRSLRFHAFHVLQTVSPHSADLDVGIPSRGWHGEGYHGHIFWDDLFVFPFLCLRFPALARELLLYRYRRLGAAQAAAQQAGYRGAMFPWRSASDGREVTPRHQLNLISGRWMPDHTYLQRHIGSAIAWNIWQFYLTTGDREFLAEHGAEMLIEIARFWASRVEHDPLHDRFDIRGVIGPDEYHIAYPGAASPGLDNNAYTNLMAVWTLCRAAEVLDHLPAGRQRELWSKLSLTADEFALWDRISRRMRIVFHDDGIISQFEGFDRLEPFDPDRLPEDLSDTRVDWALEAIGESADRYQVTKQADALTLFYLLPLKEACALLARLGYDFDEDRLRRTAAYYLARTTHRSSLSRIVYAGALAEVDLPLSWQLYQEALGTDLRALKGESTAEGVHLGAMGGTLDVLQRRYLGLGFDADGLRLEPSLPDDLGRVRISFQFRRLALAIEAENTSSTITSAPGNRDRVLVRYRGGEFHLAPGQHRTVPIRDE